jgi:hypothetical protein
MPPEQTNVEILRKTVSVVTKFLSLLISNAPYYFSLSFFLNLFFLFYMNSYLKGNTLYGDVIEIFCCLWESCTHCVLRDKLVQTVKF